MSHGGKGDRPRPYSVDTKTFENNWDAIFKNKEEVKEEKQEVPEGDVKDSTQGG